MGVGVHVKLSKINYNKAAFHMVNTTISELSYFSLSVSKQKIKYFMDINTQK